MFSNHKFLEKRTPANGIGRCEYIKLLADEYKTTSSPGKSQSTKSPRTILKKSFFLEAKLQISANLANFSYDPINYNFLKEAGVLGIFLELLVCENEQLVVHGLAGLCNICLDPESFDFILAENGFQLITNLIISSKNTEILVNALTTTIFLLETSKNSLKVPRELIEKVQQLSKLDNLRIKKLATLFLIDYVLDESIN